MIADYIMVGAQIVVGVIVGGLVVAGAIQAVRFIHEKLEDIPKDGN